MVRSVVTDHGPRTNKAAGEVLTAKQAPHRPRTAPALGLRAAEAVVILSQTTPARETTDATQQIVPVLEVPPGRRPAAPAGRPAVPRSARGADRAEHLHGRESRRQR